MTKEQLITIIDALPKDVIFHGNRQGGYIFYSATRNQYNFTTYKEAKDAVIQTKEDIRKLFSKQKKISKRGIEYEAIV